MERSDVSKYQRVQLLLLQYFDSVCKKHSWNYYLVFGSLLGAIRHKGFIPWDADIDVAMMRDEYEELLNFFIDNPSPDFFLDCWKTDPAHLSPHAILRIKGSHVHYSVNMSSRYKPVCDGIYIDIFPFDRVVSNDDHLKKQLKQIGIIHRIISLKAAPIYETTSTVSKMCKKAVSFLLSPITFRALHKREDVIMMRYNKADYCYVSNLTNPMIQKEGEIYPVECFGTPSTVLYEGLYVCAPSNPKQFLEIRYKDYMSLPPENERWSYLDKVVQAIDFGDSENVLGKYVTGIEQH